MHFYIARPSELTKVTSDRSTVTGRARSSSVRSRQKPLSSSTHTPLSSPSSLSMIESGSLSNVILSMFADLHRGMEDFLWRSRRTLRPPEYGAPHDVRDLI